MDLWRVEAALAGCLVGLLVGRERVLKLLQVDQAPCDLEGIRNETLLSVDVSPNATLLSMGVGLNETLLSMDDECDDECD